MERLTCPFIFTLLGVFLLITGTGLTLFGVKRLNDAKLSEVVTIRNRMDTFNRWIQPNKSSSFRVFIFNVTNPEEVIAGLKPRLMSIGPYTYQKRTEKFDLYYSNNLLSYKVNNSIRFDPEASGHGSEYDEITIINVPLIGAHSWKNSILSDFREGIFIKATVKELLFDGIPIECYAEEQDDRMKRRGGSVPCKNLEQWPSPLIRKEGGQLKFSFFHQSVGAAPETYTIDSGNVNPVNTGQISTVADMPILSSLEGTGNCNEVKGTDGTQFPMPLNMTARLFLYERAFCRSIYVEFERVIQPKELELYRFVIKKDLLSSKEKKPGNECFCQNPSTEEAEEICYKAGFLPLFSCSGSWSPRSVLTYVDKAFSDRLLMTLLVPGPALVASFPHFYLADDDYYSYDILKPMKRSHQTYFDIEPNFGVTILSCKRIQFNLDIRIVSAFNDGTPETSWFTLSDRILPILWTEEKTGVTEDYYQQIRYGLIQRKVLESGSAVTITLGAVFVGLSYPGWYAINRIRLLIWKCILRLTTKVDSEEDDDVVDDTWESQTRRIHQIKKLQMSKTNVMPQPRIACHLSSYFEDLERDLRKGRHPPKIDNFMSPSKLIKKGPPQPRP